MLTLYHGTNLEKLADQLLMQLNQQPPPDPLAQEIFVVQNNGIGQWLSLYMARHTGIAANLKFEFPAERMWALVRGLDPDIPQTLPSDRGPLAWSLMKLLQDGHLEGELKLLSQYSRDSDSARQTIRRWKLSEKIAEVFDQYLVFRPDLLLAWEREQRVYPQNEAEQWQAVLWRKLIRHWKNQGHRKKWLHRAGLQQKLTEALDRKQLDSQDLPHRLHVFGVSGMPPAYLQTLVKLSKTIDVRVFQLNIAGTVQQAASFENTLLQSLAREGADYLSLLEEFLAGDEEVAASFSAHEVTGGENHCSAFQQVRQDLIEDCSSGAGADTAGLEPDETLQVHSCHSPMREVEVLYDQLLGIFDERPDIHPEEVVIMTPDISTYAPLVEAVFGNPDEGQPEIPYSIADRGLDGAYPSVDLFLKLLELCESRYKVTEVLDLLDAGSLQETFQFSEDDLQLLEKWIGDNRIRWGIDGPFKKELGVPEVENCTWRSGLDRMILGYAMKPGEDQLYNGIFPYHEIETSDQAELAGRFARFLNALFDLRGRLDKAYTAEMWSELLLEMTNSFIADTSDNYRELSQIRTVIGQLQEQAALAGFDGGVPLRVVRGWLREQLENQTTGGGRIGRGVTFSSLVPMRGIPFKVVGMIGMSEGAFPRTKIPAEFDLFQQEPRKGDRSRSNDDRYLFLENMLSAQTHLYFSYVGQSNRQDGEFPPSVVLKEFLDYLDEQYGWDSQQELVRQHPLQAFNPDYFLGQQPGSYSATKKQIAGQLLQQEARHNPFMVRDLPEPEAEWRDLSVGELVEYYQHPAKFVLQNRVGIYLREDGVLDEDREPFALKGLDSYEVKQALMDRYLKEESLEDYEEVMRARDYLPQDWIGERVYGEQVAKTREFGAVVDQHRGHEPLEDLEVDLEIGPFHLVGKLSDIYRPARFVYRYGKGRAKDQVEFWIKHLLLQLVKPEGHPGVSRFIAKNGRGKIKLFELAPVEQPMEQLERMLTHFWEGLSCCSYFFPSTSFEYADQRWGKGKDEEKALDMAKDSWIKDYGFRSDGEDPYNRLIIDSRRPLQEPRFREASEMFWAPFFKSLTKRSV